MSLSFINLRIRIFNCWYTSSTWVSSVDYSIFQTTANMAGIIPMWGHWFTFFFNDFLPLEQWKNYFSQTQVTLQTLMNGYKIFGNRKCAWSWRLARTWIRAQTHYHAHWSTERCRSALGMSYSKRTTIIVVGVNF